MILFTQFRHQVPEAAEQLQNILKPPPFFLWRPHLFFCKQCLNVLHWNALSFLFPVSSLRNIVVLSRKFWQIQVLLITMFSLGVFPWSPFSFRWQRMVQADLPVPRVWSADHDLLEFVWKLICDLFILRPNPVNYSAIGCDFALRLAIIFSRVLKH